MPEPRVRRIVLRLLPEPTRREVFEPASQDLRLEYLRARHRTRSSWTRGLNRSRYGTRVFLLFVDCWRITLMESLRPRPVFTRGPGPTPHSVSKEPIAMFGYHLRHAFRQLIREPAFTLAAVLTLALGVGANVAVFAVVEALLLRPLPYTDANELAVVRHRDERTGITKEFIAIGDYVDLVARQAVFEEFAGYGGSQSTIIGHGDPFRVDVLVAGPGLLDILRVAPAIGRGLEPADSRPGAPPVMLLGHAMWRDRFGGDAGILGRTVQLGQQERQIVGVMPPGFGFPPTAQADAVVPMTVPLQAPSVRRSGWAFGLGRRRPGVSVEMVDAHLAAISRDLEREYPQSNQASVYYAVPLRAALLGNTKPALVLLFASVGVVLLIASANVANLLLARSLARRREMAVRMALGAGRGRLTLQLLTESLALASVAGIAGIVIAQWGTGALATLLPQSGEIAGLADVRINGVVLFFALAVVVTTALGFGVVSGLTVRAQDPTGSLGATTRTTASAVARRATSALVVIEVAFAIVLLIGAGLILRSFAGLLAVDPGFETEGVMTMEVQLPADRYAAVAARDAFYRTAFAELRALRDVEAAGAAVVVPLTGNNWTVPLERPEAPVPDGERPPEVGWQLASGGYFEALGIPLIAGRLFDHRERPEGTPGVIISEAIQRRFFPSENAVGRQVLVGSSRFEIVGVVGNIRRAGLQDEPRADMYFPFENNPGGTITLFVRTATDPAGAFPAMQRVLRDLEPHLLFLETRTLSDVAADSIRVTRLVFLLLGLFAVTTLALAAVGIYGVMSYAVRQRTREIGMRIALGASRSRILWLVFRQGILIAVVGSAIGLVTGLAATRLLESTLYGVSATDPATLAVAVTVLVATVLSACYVPARRAAAVDPVKTLAVQ